MPYEPIGVYEVPPPADAGEGIRSLRIDGTLDPYYITEAIRTMKLITRARDRIFRWAGELVGP